MEEIQIEDNIQELPDNREKDDSFKLQWREFAKDLADRTNTTLSEDEKDINFNAKLTSQDGSYTRITASSTKNVALMARDDKGNKKVPKVNLGTFYSFAYKRLFVVEFACDDFQRYLCLFAST